MPAKQNRAARRGMNDQRDRGRRKKDHRAGRSKRNRHELNEDNFTIFENWLATDFVDESGRPVEPSQSISLHSFLQSTAQFELAPDERLRILAIHFEFDCAIMDQPTGWNILKRIYKEALKYDSTWGTQYHSMSISARACASAIPPDCVEDRDALLKEARSACLEGLVVDPKNASLHLSLGRCEYGLRNQIAALAHFEDSLKLDSQQMWSALYRAHCLHDLERWPEAVFAYEAVDLSFFDGPHHWRTHLLRDQLAECYLRSGNREKALEEFTLALGRYESNPRMLETPDYLIRAAKGELQNEISPRLIALLKKEEFFDQAQSVRGYQKEQ